MKIIHVIVACFLVLPAAFASQRFDAATWKKVQTYDVPSLLKQEASLMGRVVAVRFYYRSEKLRHFLPSWYEASIWQRDPSAKKGFSALQVVVEKKDLPAFQTISFDPNSAVEETVYALVEKDPNSNAARLRLLGRKVALDSAGNATVDW